MSYRKFYLDNRIFSRTYDSPVQSQYCKNYEGDFLQAYLLCEGPSQ